MKRINLYHNRAFLLFILAALLFNACDTENEFLINETVQVGYLKGDVELFENETEGVQINLSFADRLESAGSIQVILNPGSTARYGEDFTTTPAMADGVFALDLNAGAEEVSFDIQPVFDTSLNADKLALFDLVGSGSATVSLNTDAVSVLIKNRPQLTITGTVEAFGPVLELESSDPQVLQIKGAGLLNPVEISVTRPYEISLEEDEGYVEMLQIDATAANNNEQNLYIRLSPDFDVLGTLSSTLSINSIDALGGREIALNGTSEMQSPTIITDGALVDFGNALIGENSEIQSLKVSGYRLSEDILVSAPDNFEVSSDGTSFSAALNLDFNTINALDSLDLQVRFSPSSGQDGLKTGDLLLTSAGADSISIPISGFEGFPLETVAFTSFEEVPAIPDSITYSAPDGFDLPNNTNQPPIDFMATGMELGFDLSYVNDPELIGGADDAVILGVIQESAEGIQVEVPGLEFPDGMQAYVISDADGLLELVFDEVAISADATGISVEISILFADASWEASDEFDVFWQTADGLGDPLISIRGVEPQDDIEINGLSVENQWLSLVGNVSPDRIATGRIVIQIGNNSGSELMFIDQVTVKSN